jgi:hypothetical protein
MQRRNNKAENPRSISPRGEDQKLWYVCLVADAKKQRRWNTFSLLFHIYISHLTYKQNTDQQRIATLVPYVTRKRARAHTHTYTYI